MRFFKFPKPLVADTHALPVKRECPRTARFPLEGTESLDGPCPGAHANPSKDADYMLRQGTPLSGYLHQQSIVAMVWRRDGMAGLCGWASWSAQGFWIVHGRG
uniref:Uncharacterized protein n=1 Tax=Eutreptiella gymnastica TaxID=73025 RepID=A0A7S1IZN4_9EUGL|mmetsp:Transcript_55423/g.98718  ORF Transcript_55423/g.98718 Transcript_55423/m.98718 type:complete len:103 (+) Transcript_55423:92-400(+)